MKGRVYLSWFFVASIGSLFACCLWVRVSCDVGLKWLISAVIRRLGVYANVRRKAKKYKPSPSPRPIYRGLGIRPLLTPSLASPPFPSHSPPRSQLKCPPPLRLLPPLIIATQLGLCSYFALPLRLLRSALSGSCSPFPGNIALTSPFILMSPSPQENIARLKAVLGQKLIPREISCGREACICYEKEGGRSE